MTQFSIYRYRDKRKYSKHQVNDRQVNETYVAVAQLLHYFGGNVLTGEEGRVHNAECNTYCKDPIQVD